MTAAPGQPAPRRRDGAMVHVFLLLVLGAVAAFGAWAWFGRLDVVAVAQGEVIPSTQVKSVQHLEGGIVREILVKEGARVARGQPLVELEPERSGADVAEIKARLEGRPISTRLIIAGPPGSGKGVQTQAILDEFKVAHASSAELLRSAMASGTVAGAQAKSQLQKDGRVSESLLIKIVIEALTTAPLSTSGWILDGFPRTTAQVRMRAWSD